MSFSSLLPFSNRVSFIEKLLFTKHLAVMVKSGITISESLITLADQSKSKRFKKIILSVLHDIENGGQLHKALNKFPQVFDEFYVSLIEVSEESGTLDKTLEFLAKQLAKEYALKKKIQGAALYPALVLLVALIMGSFVSLFILPRLSGIFSEFQVELPLTTRILISLADFMKKYNVIFVFSVFLFVFSSIFFVNSPPIKPLWNRIILRLPIIGEIIASNQLARFSRNLGTLLVSGVDVIRAIEITADTLSNLKFKHDLLNIAQEISRGKNLSDTLHQKKFDEFPPLVVKILSVGEKTGQLDQMLLYLADFYDDEIDNTSKNFVTILEPVLLIVVGLIVGFLSLAIISPIYQITGSINR